MTPSHGSFVAAHSRGSVLPPFSVRTVQSDRVRVVEVEGEVDILTAPKIAAALRDDDAFDAVVLDLDKVPFMGSAGLGVLVSVSRRLARHDGTVVLAAVHPDVRRVLEISGLLDTFIVAADVHEALARVSPPHG
jgi:anti-sigma B factor antagonist